MLLACFHCAGCDGSMFTSVLMDQKRVGNSLVEFCKDYKVDLFTPTLRGRGPKAAQRFSGRLNEEVGAALAEDPPGLARLKHEDWALVGHSMGGASAYSYFYQACVLGSARPPRFAVLSASWDPPTMGPKPWPPVSSLSDAEFRDELVHKWRVNPKVAVDNRIWDYIRVRLREDFAALESHEPYPAVPVDFPVYHLVGSDDHYINRAAIEKHRRWITNRYETLEIPAGDHALYHQPESRERVFQFIIDKLRPFVAGECSSSDDELVCSF